MTKKVKTKYKPAVVILLVGLSLFGWKWYSTRPAIEELTVSNVDISKVAPPQQLGPNQTQAQARPEVRPEARISLILKDLVETHPSPQISRDLNRIIVNGDIALNFQPAMSPGAVATIMWINTPSEGLMLTLVTPAEWLLDPSTSRRLKQLVIFHEYQHLRDQLDERVPREMAFGANEAAMAQLSERQLEIWFESEYRAYAAESELAISLGWQREFAFCEVYARSGRAGLRQAMADSYCAMPVYRRHAAVLRRIAAR